MPDYAAFFLDSKSKIVKLQTLEISHPSFSKTYYIVRNATEGISATLETGENVFFEYYPCEIVSKGSYNDLDQGVDVSFGELGEILPVEFDNVTKDDNYGIKPKVNYREYRSDDLTRPMLGPWKLEVKPISENGKNATFEAIAPSANINGSGILYAINGKFRTLVGFL